LLRTADSRQFRSTSRVGAMNPSKYSNLQKVTVTKRERLISASRKGALTVAVLSLFLFRNERAGATLLYATASAPDSHIYTDQSLIPSSQVPYFLAALSPDSLMFDTMGRILYTAISAGQVRIIDVNANPQDSLIAPQPGNPLLNHPADVLLEPGGHTMLVSEFGLILLGGGKIDRIDLVSPSHPITQLWPPSNGSGSGNPEGLAYDNVGRLFANLGLRGLNPTDPPAKYVAQLDPVTGAILHQSPCPPQGGSPCLSSLDGLTYDSFTQKLYAASLYGKTVYQIDPNNLSSPVDLRQLYGWTKSQIKDFVPDGITSDGSGHLFVASVQVANFAGDGHIYDINLVTGTLSRGDFISNTLDDLAPASGLGAPPGELFPAQQCCGEKPHFEDPAYSSVFTGKVAVATCNATFPGDPVLVVEDLKNQATAPLNTNYAPPAYDGPASSWNQANLGDIFGLTLDDSGNIFVGASTAYGSNFFPGGSAMVIFRIDGGSGGISVFKVLPQSPATYPGAGLGNITYDCTYKDFYVSNLDDGLIYRLDINGNTLSTWDHGVNLPTAQPPSAAIPDVATSAFTPLGRRVWGLQAHDGRLYYAIWWEDAGRPDPLHANEVWSIALSSSGNFVPGTDRLEISMPVDVYNDNTVTNYSNPVSDISFGPAGTMLLTERTMAADTIPNAHEARALEYVLSGTSWVPSPNVFSIGTPGLNSGYQPLIIPGNSAGGGDYDFGAGGRVWVTGDGLHFAANDYIYGLQGLPATGGSIINSILIDLNGDVTENNKSQIGDVELPCPDCEINGTVVTPATAGAPYTYQFTVTNHSTQAASTIVILPVSGVTSITPQTILLSPALQPGQTSPTFTLTLNGVQPGVQACFNIALVAADGTNCCSRQLCVPIPDCFEVLSQAVTCLPNGQVQLTVTIKNLEAYTLYYAAVVPSNPSKTATPSFFTLTNPVPPFGTTTISTIISPVGFLETVFYTLTIHSANLEVCCSRNLSFTANCKRIIKTASSRLTHGDAGPFDIDMPLTGSSGVEDRDGSGSYLAVFTYDDAVTSGEATIVSGTATAGVPTFSGDEMQVPLTGVADQQNVTIEVSNVDGDGGTDDVTFGFLIGDANGDRKVNNTDGNQIKANKGQLVTGSNFRDDINLSGRVDNPDSKAVTANKNHRLP
jgi:hypothetical protein